VAKRLTGSGRQNFLCLKDYWPIHQLAIDCDCADAGPRCGDDPLCPFDLCRARCKAAVDRLNLCRVNAQVAAETKTLRANYIRLKRFERLDVDSHALDRRRETGQAAFDGELGPDKIELGAHAFDAGFEAEID